MGIDADGARFLIQAKRDGASFERMITLGRLEWFVPPDEMELLRKHFPGGAFDAQNFKQKYSEPFYTILGAHTADSMDASDYEQATVIHDMNDPLPDRLKGKYTVVYDGGTMEHIFNTPQALRNCMEALEVGGHYLAMTPANNSMGHGFYQFSPELFYSVFTTDNGFRVKRMLITTTDADGNAGAWYTVADPHAVGGRVMLVNDRATFILLIAEKIADVPVFRKHPQQSDYVSGWNIVRATQEGAVREGEGRMKMLYRRYMPMVLKDLVRKSYVALTHRTTRTADLGVMDARFFTPFPKP